MAAAHQSRQCSGNLVSLGIPPHPQRYQALLDESEPFQLVLKTLEGLPFRASLLEGVADVQCQLRLSLFDITYSHFFGRTWKSSPHPIKHTHGQLTKVSFNQAVYFHTPLNCTHLAIIVEVVAIARKREGNEQILSCGFGILHLPNRQKLASDADRSQKAKRLNLYHGTPRALLHPASEDPIERNRFMTLIEGSTIIYSLLIHPPLMEVRHLIPENLLISGSETIPGVAAPSGQTSDALKKPHLLKTVTCFLDKLSLQLYPTVEKFEEELVELLNADRLLKSDQVADGSTVVIQERRLHVGVHNGLCYVQKPQVVVLIPGTMQGKSGNISKSLLKKSLILRSRIQLTEIVKHQSFGIVFHLEYVFYTSAGQKGTVSSTTSMDQTAYMQTLRWAVWNPFMGPSTSDITVSLQGGPSPNPSNLLVYKTPSTEMSSDEVKQVESGTITFHFSCRGDRRVSLSSEQPANTSEKKSQMSSSSMRKTSEPSGPQQGTGEALQRGSIIYMDSNAGPNSQMVEQLHELPFIPNQPPIMAMGTEIGGTTTVTSRAALAQMHAFGFPEIRDDNNELAVVIDSDNLPNINLRMEESDHLQSNEIILQFLAFSRVPPESNHPRAVYFTFQFYRFPPVTTQQLQLVKVKGKGSSNSMPFILVPLHKNGIDNIDSPGLELKFMVEPSLMKDGEQLWFMQYLAMQTLQIDVWDGESLLLIGTASVDLKHLLRHGLTAVQVSHELDVVSTDYAPDVPMSLSDFTNHGAVKPNGVTTVTKGRLHLRLGNVGHQSELRAKGFLPFLQSKVISAHDGISGFSGGSLSTVNVRRLKADSVRRAQRLVDLDSELASVLFSRARVDSFGQKQLDSEAEVIRRRKLSRMMSVRQLESGTPLQSKSHILAKREERIQHERDLQLIEAYREQTKAETISKMLSQAISTQFTLYSTLGNAEFFEFTLKNPYNVQHTVTIECEHPELSVIVNSREWKYFKNLSKVLTPLEEDMFHVDGGMQFPQIYLRPKETVYIPFKFQTFSADHSVPSQGPANGSLVRKNLINQQQSNTPKIIEVYFKIENQKPIAILHVNVAAQPYVIDQTFRFYHPELTFLKKSIRLPPLHVLKGMTVQTSLAEFQIHVRCSDLNVICEAKKMAPNEPQDLFLKVACGPSPEIKKFFLMIYMDPWLAVPIQIWQFYVQSLHRIDVNCVVGQRTQLSLVLRGTQSARNVAAYTSNTEELKIKPSDVFLLPPHVVKDLHISIRPQKEGDRCIYLNVVDVDFHQLVASWLIFLNCTQPTICKAFEISIPVEEGKGSNKRISYTNPYPTKRVYFLRNNRPDLLQFKEDSFQVEGGETYHIGLRFAPSQNPGEEEILIFINDQAEKNEETYCVKITYQ
ncbi:nephrocystin-4 [Pristis pectinata]|uniref:nephrocystin-4 n=1 Tax=Pristis pectinata TaxID=685728 RepID=UPI00223CF8C1|nr:nephrocystin-4 [Pristis pectinata]